MTIHKIKLELQIEYFFSCTAGRLFDQTGDVLGVRHVLSAHAAGQLFQHDARAIFFRNVRRTAVSGLQHGGRGEDLFETGRQHVSI